MQGRFTYYDATVASFATLSSEVDLGGAYKSAYLEVPTMTSNTQVHLQAASTSGGTYRRVYHPAVNTAAASSHVWGVASALTNALIPLPDNLRYVKVETTAVVSFSAQFRILVGE